MDLVACESWKKSAKYAHSGFRFDSVPIVVIHRIERSRSYIVTSSRIKFLDRSLTLNAVARF
jgi:hypothetical protein